MENAPLGTLNSYAKAAFVAFCLAALAFLLLPTSQAAPADEGQAIFEQKCKGCHTIGGGRAAGPDLKGVTNRQDRGWVIRFIVSPDQLIAQGDATAKKLVQEYGLPMPSMGISQQDAEKVLAYIEAQSGGASGQTTPSTGQGTASGELLPAGDASIGKDLFVGGVLFSNGAAACISCHDVKGIGGLGGGTVGKDLTAAFTSFGQEGLQSIVRNAPFPVMRETYADHPLTDAEVAHVVAFLKEAGSTGGQQAQSPLLFLIVGLVGFVPVMGLFQFIWRGRLQGVHQRLVKGGSK